MHRYVHLSVLFSTGIGVLDISSPLNQKSEQTWGSCGKSCSPNWPVLTRVSWDLKLFWWGALTWGCLRSRKNTKKQEDFIIWFLQGWWIRVQNWRFSSCHKPLKCSSKTSVCEVRERWIKTTTSVFLFFFWRVFFDFFFDFYLKFSHLYQKFFFRWDPHLFSQFHTYTGQFLLFVSLLNLQFRSLFHSRKQVSFLKTFNPLLGCFSFVRRGWVFTFVELFHQNKRGFQGLSTDQQGVVETNGTDHGCH